MACSKLLRDLMKPDTAQAISARITARKACEQAHAETLARFGCITPENAREAIAWQEKRIAQLRGY